MCSVLAFFTSGGNLDTLKEALKHWDVNAQDENGMTALHHAAYELYFHIVDYLLQEEGIDPTLKDKFHRDAAWIVLDVHGYVDEAKKMYDKLEPYCHPIAEEDLELYADDAPTNEEEDARLKSLGYEIPDDNEPEGMS